MKRDQTALETVPYTQHSNMNICSLTGYSLAYIHLYLYIFRCRQGADLHYDRDHIHTKRWPPLYLSQFILNQPQAYGDFPTHLVTKYVLISGRKQKQKHVPVFNSNNIIIYYNTMYKQSAVSVEDLPGVDGVAIAGYY